MKKLISALLALSVLLMSAVGYAEEIKMEIELPEYIPTGSYMAPEGICVGTVEPTVSLFSQAVQTEVFDYVYKILYDCDMNYYNNGYIEIPIYNEGYRMTVSQLDNLMERLVNEYGELLLSVRYGYSVTNDADLWVVSIKFQYVFDMKNDEGNPDAAVIKNKRAEIENKVNPFIIEMSKSSLSDLEKVLLTHDFIASNAIYLRDRSLINETYYHSLHSAIVGGETVCQGYTLAMCYILKQIGIDCVSCVCDEVNHVWNCVKVDGKWYHVDLTGDDIRETTEDLGIIIAIYYNSFMVSYEKTYNIVCDAFNKSLTDNSFVYPSGKVTNQSSDNSDYENGYVFNNIYVNTFDYPTKDGTNISDCFLPSGFSYSDGKIVYTLNTLGKTDYGSTYSFLYDSLRANDYAVSVPSKQTKYGYVFLFIEQNKPINSVNDFGGYMKYDVGDSNFCVNDFTVKGIAQTGNSYGLAAIYVPELVSSIDRSNKTEFFFWDGNMRPLTQKTAYQNQ